MTRDEALDKVLVFYDQAERDNVRKLATDLLGDEGANLDPDDIEEASARARDGWRAGRDPFIAAALAAIDEACKTEWPAESVCVRPAAVDRRGALAPEAPVYCYLPLRQTPQ